MIDGFCAQDAVVQKPRCCLWEPPASRCFDVDVSDDGSKLKCAFAHCNCGAPWIPNVYVEAEKLARHVSRSINDYVKRINAERESNEEFLKAVGERKEVAITKECAIVIVLLDLLSFERWPSHEEPPDHFARLSSLVDLFVSQSSPLLPLHSPRDCHPR